MSASSSLYGDGARLQNEAEGMIAGALLELEPATCKELCTQKSLSPDMPRSQQCSDLGMLGALRWIP